MKRGFKAEAKRLALELRAEIDLGPSDPFDPWALAELYGIAVYDLESIDCPPRALRHFTTIRSGVWSGALISYSDGLIILENSAHAVVRRRSTISHEMAHVALEHEFSLQLTHERGCGTSDPEQEEEAAELSGELLIPFEAACIAARRGHSDLAVAQHFEVSEEVARWRMNASGARKIAQRRAEAYARRVRGG